MATIKNDNVVNNINIPTTEGEAKTSGLSSERRDTSSFNYGDYSLANVAMVMNTVNALASHIYSKFIPNDRIAHTTYDIDDIQIGLNLIFRKTKNGETLSVTDKDNRNYLNYLITGQVLSNNIEYHKPQINGSVDYSSSNNFLIDEAPSSADGTDSARNNTLWAWDNAGTRGQWRTAKVSSKYESSSISVNSTDGIILRIDNNLKTAATASAELGAIATANEYTLKFINDSFLDSEAVITSAGLVKSVRTKNSHHIAKKENTNQTGNFTFDVYVPGTGDAVKKMTLTFNKNGLLINTSTVTTDFRFVQTDEAQTFTGVKTFSSGISLPGSPNGSIFLA